MQHFRLKFPLFLLLSAMTLNAAYAAEVANTPVNSTDVQNTQINSTSIGTAKDWNVTPEEFDHYQQLMKGSSGKWYRQLSPAEVLGINAQSEEERQHFAAIVATEQHDKLARELQFDSAVHQALVQQYANEPVIRPFDTSPFNPIKNKNSSPLLLMNKNTKFILQSGDQLALFVDTHAGLEFAALPPLLSALQKTPGTQLNIYCVGNVSDADIQQWASLNHIPVVFVSSGRVTLNHDKGKLQTLAGHVALPYVALLRNSQTTAVPLKELGT